MSNSKFEFEFMRNEMAYAVDTIFEAIDTLHSVECPDKDKIKNITDKLTKTAMIIYADERDFIELQHQKEELHAMLDEAEEEMMH